MNEEIPESLNNFGGELERALKRELGRSPAPKLRGRPRLLAGTTVAFAAIATALALAFTAASSSPAFAVTRNHDGSVSVRITRLSGVAGANARLKTLHIHARFVQMAAGCTQGPIPPTNDLVRAAGKWRVAQTNIKPWRIPRGRTLVIVVRTTVISHTGMRQVPIPICKVLQAQARKPGK